MRPISRTITSLLAAAGAGFAVSAMICASVAVAQVCEPSQLDNNGQCTVPDKNVPAPPGKLMCNQSGHCTDFEGG
jgi:hypothetical protein